MLNENYFLKIPQVGCWKAAIPQARTPCRGRRKQRQRERWVKNLGSGDTNTIWTVTEGEGERERLLHPAKLRRGRRMSKQREERRKAKTGAQESKGDWNGKGDLSSMALSVAEGKTKMLSTSTSPFGAHMTSG